MSPNSRWQRIGSVAERFSDGLIRLSPVPALLLAALLLAAVRSGFAAAGDPPRVANPATPQIQRTLESWKTACGKLPSNRSLRGRWPPTRLLPLPRFSEFDEVLTAFFAQCQTGSLSQGTTRARPMPTTNAFFNPATAYFLPSAASASSPAIPFEPFAQKLSVGEESEIFFRADLHGDVRSLLADLTWLNVKGYLRDFSVARTNFYMIFLGDYTDRGAYGIEVLYTLLRLKLENPDRVFLVRGNHEEVGLQARYGFLEEGRIKYGVDFNARKVERPYDFLPVVIYAGSGENFIQCNHGGLEPAVSPQPLLEAASPLSLPLSPMVRRLGASRGAFRHWQEADSRSLANASVSQLSRTLEQTEERAIPPGSVWTFNASPDSVYGEGSRFNFDTFGILKVARNFAD